MFKLFSRHWSIPSAVSLLTETAILVGSLWLAFLIRFDGEPERYFATSELVLRATTFAAVILSGLYINGLYDFTSRQSAQQLLVQLSRALAFSAIGLLGVYYVFPAVWTGRGVFAIALGIAGLVLAGWRLLLRWFLVTRFLNERVLIVGSDDAAVMLAREIMEREHLGYHVVGFVADDAELQGLSLVNPQVIGTTADALDLAIQHRANRVVVAQRENRGRVDLDSLLRCKTSGIPVEKGPDYYEQLTGKIMLEDITVKSWLIFSRGFVVSRSVRVMKRALDLAVSAAGLLLSAPLMLLTALAIKIESRGPALYGQERVGRQGRLFTVWKFRSMRADAEPEGEAVWALEEDPRVTVVGRLLRKFRIDELPQLWNVLIGDMSLVGPRPEREPFVRELIERFPLYEQRLVVRPGVTGWAQIRGSYASSFEESNEKLRYDLYYIKNLSILLDLSILASTFRIVLVGQGAR